MADRTPRDEALTGIATMALIEGAFVAGFVTIIGWFPLLALPITIIVASVVIGGILAIVFAILGIW